MRTTQPAGILFARSKNRDRNAHNTFIVCESNFFQGSSHQLKDVNGAWFLTYSLQPSIKFTKNWRFLDCIGGLAFKLAVTFELMKIATYRVLMRIDTFNFCQILLLSYRMNLKEPIKNNFDPWYRVNSRVRGTRSKN
jgi:hypothetical protein